MQWFVKHRCAGKPKPSASGIVNITGYTSQFTFMAHMTICRGMYPICVLFLSGVLVFLHFCICIGKENENFSEMKHFYCLRKKKAELSLRKDSNGVRLYEGLLGIPPDLEPSPSALFPAAVWNFFLNYFFFLKLSLLDN